MSQKYGVYCNNVNVIRGAELNTRHRLVLANTNIRKPVKDRIRYYTKINLTELEQINKKQEYMCKITDMREILQRRKE